MFIPINSEAQKFQCSACGTCCSHIRGIIPKEDREFLSQYAFGKMPVIQLVPVEQMTFPLWDWEAKRFSEWQNEADVDANIKPLRVIFDLRSNKTIILNYFMDGKTDACPFLKNNKCSIYHTKRAYVCRLFPFSRSPFSFQQENISKESLFGECGAMKNILPNVPEDFEKMVRFLNDSFPDGSFINAVQNDIVVEWMNKTIIALIKNKIIKPAVNHPYDVLLKQIESAEKTDFTDFLVQCGFLTEKEKEDLISRFDNNIDAKEKISQFIQ